MKSCCLPPGRRSGGFLCKTTVAFFLTLFFITQCHQPPPPLDLSSEEREWIIANSGKITIAPCPDYPPIDFIDSDGNHTGLASDYLRRIEEILGFKFLISHQKDWFEVINLARDGKIDAVLTIQKTPEREKYLIFTEPFAVIPNKIIVRSNNTRTYTLPEMRGMKTSMVKGYAVTEYVTSLNPLILYDPAPNEQKAILRVSFGQSDAAIVSLSSASYFIEKMGISNLRVAGSVNFDWRLTIATRKDLPVLNRLLNRALNNIPPHERENLARKWISLGHESIFLNKKLWAALIITMTAILLIIIAILAWNRTLRRQVAQRTEELKNELLMRKNAQTELAKEKERLMVTLKWIAEGVISTDTEGTIVIFNRVAGELTGWSLDEAPGRNIRDIMKLKDRESGSHWNDPVAEILKSAPGTGSLKDALLESKNGHELAILISGSSIRDDENRVMGSVLVFHDITERLRIEEELNRSQKLESLGILAGGIAHDFNNILSAILGNANLLEHHLKNYNADDNADLAAKTLVEIDRAVIRARGLTLQLLTFSKGGKPVKTTGIVTGTLMDSALFALTGTNVKLDSRISENIWPAEFDEGQISQVFNNLVINARQAMPDGGTIVISAENYYKEWDPALNRNNGRYVKITVSDSGIGIPKEQLGRIFDPYFTTKRKGSGLGLTSVFSIITLHNGYIDVESKPGQGSEFTIYLPASDRKPEKGTDDSDQKVFHSSGTVLVMDDEDQIRELLGRMLDYLGYQVLYAKDGEDALAVFRDRISRGMPVNAVILDLTIPGGMGGRETLEKLRKLDPAAMAIASSGYSQDYSVNEYGESGFSAFLQKPFRLYDLSKTLFTLINR